jgi:hypothetical protein
MVDKRQQADRILVAQLTGEAGHHAKWRELSSDEETAAVAALRELAGGRADLLAEVAGVLEGARGGAGRAAYPPGCGPVPQGRGRPRGNTGVDRGRPQARGRGEAPSVLGRPACRGSRRLTAYRGTLLGACLCQHRGLASRTSNISGESSQVTALRSLT